MEAVGAGDDRGLTVGRLRERAAARSYLGGGSMTVLVELQESSGAKEEL